VEATGRSAYDLGYNVTFAVDAMTDLSDGMHRQSVEKVFPKLGETDTTENVLKLLKDAATRREEHGDNNEDGNTRQVDR
jgi:nicotinamidase-related amidase